MYFVDRTAVVLKPTARFLEWLKSADENMPDLTIEQIRANCSVFLVPQFDEPEAVIAYFDERYQQIFEAELAGWDIDKSKWPQDMSLKAFWEFFDTEIHDMVLDMEEAELSITPVFDNMMQGDARFSDDLEAVPFFKSLVRFVAFVRSGRVPDMVLRLDDVVRAGGVGGQFCPRLARGEFADGGCGKENRLWSMLTAIDAARNATSAACGQCASMLRAA